MAADRFARSRGVFERAVRVIPGGIYGTKSPGFLIPGKFPYYIESASGSRIVDADGNVFVDYLCGFGSQIVGYGNPAVERAGSERSARGDLLNQPSPLMVDLAERLVSRIRGMDWTVFAKNGTDATTLAVSLARVHTGKRVVIAAEGAYHGAANWCSSNLFPELAPDRADVAFFRYNDLDGLEALFRRHRGNVACVILTPHHHPAFRPQVLPDPELYPTVRGLCEAEDALFVMDDIRDGFRLHPEGSHVRFGAEPDLVCVAKALANGWPLAALLGTERVRSAADSFFITGTYWMSGAPMAAALACLDEMDRLGGVARMEALGTALKEGLEAAGREAGFGARVSGPAAVPFLTFDEDPDLYLNQRFCGAMADRGFFLHPHHNWFVSLAHTEADIAATVEAAREVFAEMKAGRV